MEVKPLVWRSLSELVPAAVARATTQECVLTPTLQMIIADADALFAVGCGKGLKTLRQRLEETGCVFND